MKTTILLILSLVLFTSCSADDTINGNSYKNTAEVNYNEEYIINEDISNDFIGVYSHHLGEETTGTIVITKTRLIINTSKVYYDIDLTTVNKKRLWCKDTIYDIKFTNEEGEEIFISIVLWKNTIQPHITIAINYNILGVFDLVKETVEEPVKPTEPVIEH